MKIKKSKIFFLIFFIFIVFTGIGIKLLSLKKLSGVLDPTFKIFTFDFTKNESFTESLAIQEDGKIVLCGRFENNYDSAVENIYSVSLEDGLVIRLNPDGSLDKNFGKNGVFIYKASEYSDDIVRSIAIQKDGKLVFCGGTYDRSKTYGDVLVVRLNPDGSLDKTFAMNGEFICDVGKVFYDVVERYEEITSIAIQKDGKIVVGGYSWNSYTDNYDILVIRLDKDGNLDQTFGKDGIFIYNIKNVVYFDNFAHIKQGSDDFGESIAIQEDGKIVICGYTWNGDNKTGNDSDKYDVLVMRLNSDGTLDRKFGKNGLFIYDIGKGFDQARSLMIQKDRKIVVCGTTDAVNKRGSAMVIRLNPDGSLDKNFGKNGVCVYNIGNFNDSDAESVAIQKDGKIIVCGTAYEWDKGRIFVMKLKSDGNLDQSFADNGIFVYDRGKSDYVSMAIQKDGKIVVGGSIMDFDKEFKIFVIRLLP